MAATLKHRTQTVVADDPSYPIGADEWNDSLLAAGGTNQGLFFYDTGVTDQWNVSDALLWDKTAKTLTIAQGTLTDTSPALSITATWNDGTETFTAAKVNVTVTAAAATSLLFDFQAGSTSMASIRKDGRLTARSALFWDGAINLTVIDINNGHLRFQSGAAVQWASTQDALNGTFDTALSRLAAGQVGHATLLSAIGIGTATPKTYEGIAALTAAVTVFGTDAGVGAIGSSTANLLLDRTASSANQRILGLENTSAGFAIKRWADNFGSSVVYLSASLATDVVTLGSASVAGVNYISGTGDHTFSDGPIVHAGTGATDGYWLANTTAYGMGFITGTGTAIYSNSLAAIKVLTNGSVRLGGSTVTTSSPILDLAQTMNAAAVAFIGVKAVFTEGASGTAAGTLLLDLQYGTSGAEASKFTVSKAGAVSATSYQVGGNAFATTNSSPGDPTGTTSTTGVMMGLAGAITTRSGRVVVIISGTIKNNTANDGAAVQIRYGTGSAPTNAAALTGTAVGALQRHVDAGVTNEEVPFSVSAVVTGLTGGTAYWLDVSLAAITGGTATITGVNVTAFDIA